MSKREEREWWQRYVGSYFYLCGKYEWPPSAKHAASVGRRMPKGVFKEALASVQELGWGTLSPSGRFLWTQEGKEELTALHEIFQRGQNW